MKFTCGLTKSEKQLRQGRKIKAKRKYLQNWHTKFAILPINIAEKYATYKRCVWLERYQRRWVFFVGEFDRLYLVGNTKYGEWEYRCFSVKKDDDYM